MTVEAFSSTATIVGAITGGVEAVDRALLLSRGTAQSSVAKSLQEQFGSRIDAALANLNDGVSNAKTQALAREQAVLIGRKSRITEAVEVISQALSQFDFLKNHITYLEEQITSLENGDITASELATDWDNKLRKINQLSDAGDEQYFDGGLYYQKNLIGSLSRETFLTQNLYAPFNSEGDLYQIAGVYLGTDYHLTETSPGSEVWYSDVGFLGSEDATGTLTEYTSFPNTPTGNTEDVTTINFTGFTDNAGSDDVVTFNMTDATPVTATVNRGGLGILDAWLYDDFSTAVDANAIERAKADLNAAEGKILTAQAEFRADLQALQSRSSIFDSLIDGIEKEIQANIQDVRDDQEADLLALQLEFEVAKFGLSLLAARGSTLVFSLIIAQDAGTGDVPASTKRSGEAVLGATLNVRA